MNAETGLKTLSRKIGYFAPDDGKPKKYLEQLDFLRRISDDEVASDISKIKNKVFQMKWEGGVFEND